MATMQQPAPVSDGAYKYGGAMGKRKTAVIVLICWVLAMFVQTRIDPRRHYYNPILGKSTGGFVDSFRNNLFGASFLGFREVVAGMLWVKADELFHAGRYEDIVPYFSLVTFMDPHQVDVYSTGAWHLMYNFGDSRMNTQGLAFLEEGIKNNPTVWDLYFQRGWVTFDWPVENYKEALPFFVEGATKQGTNGQPPPPYISHVIAHDLTHLGRIREAEAQWRKDLAFAEAKYAAQKKLDDPAQTEYWRQERDVCRQNLDRVLVRDVARKDIAKHPHAVRIEAHVEKVRPRVLKLDARVFGIPQMTESDGSPTNARMEVVLQDYDYDKQLAAHKTDYAWIGKHLTRYRSIYNIVETNGVVTDKGKPGVLIELDKDPMLEPPRNPVDLYPLDSKKYELILRIDPNVRRQPEAMRDYFGWIGEGLAPGPQTKDSWNGGKFIEYRITLDKDQIV